MKRAIPLLFSLLPAFSLLAADVGPEIEVTAATTSPVPAQRNVFIANFDLATLVAFEERTPEGVSRVLLHQYRANTGQGELDRETFSVGTPFVAQYQPRLEKGLLAYIEEDPAATYPWLTWQQVWPGRAGNNFAPSSLVERVAEVKPGTAFTVFRPSLFYLLVWTAPDGRLRAAYRQVQTLVGFDQRPFFLTEEPALNPSAGGAAGGQSAAVLAYNRPEASGKSSLRAISVLSYLSSAPIDIAGEGALEPHAVWNGTDAIVFWSMESGGAFAQRVRTDSYDRKPFKSGQTVRFADGILQDVTLGPDLTYYAVVDEGWRYSLLHLDANLNVIETSPFRAVVAAGEKVHISGDTWRVPVIAYAAETYAAPRAVLRTLTQRAPAKRRSAR